MFELDASNAAEYLSTRRGFDPGALRVTPLGGGVSNTVLLVESGETRFVLKQSLGKLQVEQDWFSDRDRIFRECAGLRVLAPHLPPGAVPEIRFEDRESRLFAMSAAPRGARTWKSVLLAGEADAEIAEQVARMQAVMIRMSWRDPELGREFGDRTVFDQLRLDPYYRSTAKRHPDLKPFFTRLVEEYADFCFCLVHGDWSPKNFLLSSGPPMAIDFEVIHFGDPAFDTAFLLNHLLLKSFHRPEWKPRYALLAERYWQVLAAGLPAGAEWMEARTVTHLGGLLLARVDGKSPAEYLREEEVRGRVRRFARNLILDPPARLLSVFE